MWADTAVTTSLWLLYSCNYYSSDHRTHGPPPHTDWQVWAVWTGVDSVDSVDSVVRWEDSPVIWDTLVTEDPPPELAHTTQSLTEATKLLQIKVLPPTAWSASVQQEACVWGGFVLDDLCSWSHREELDKISKLKQASIHRVKTKECERCLYKYWESAVSSEATVSSPNSDSLY